MKQGWKATAALAAIASMASSSPMCRIHTDAVNESNYDWRAAWTPSLGGGFKRHPYGVCNEGKGPWAYGASNLTVVGCTAMAAKLNATCFDFYCPYQDAADCQCPTIPPVTPTATAVRVSCVGDSITAGYLSSCGLDYPSQLSTLLGDGYHVQNFGVGGTTLTLHGDHPYANHSAFAAAMMSAPDVVVIMLGTNDAKVNNWGNATIAAEYPGDYAWMIDGFRTLPSRPKVHIMVPPPLYKNGVYGMNQSVINTVFPPLIKKIAADAGLDSPVDLFSLFQGHCPVVGGTPGYPNNDTDTYCDWVGGGGLDGCHPDDVGYGKLAAVVKAAISK